MKVTFVTHSCFVVELEKSVLVFDYYKGELPEFDEEKGLYFFASHSHGDHYTPAIFSYGSQWKRVHYVLSPDICPEEEEWTAAQQVIRMEKEEERELDDLRIRTLPSTDEGVAYLVETEGVYIYHAGDLNWWHWEGEDRNWNLQMAEDYQKEMGKLAGKRLDLAFVPADPRLGAAYFWGAKFFLEQVQVVHLFPMHFWGDFSVCKHLKEEPELQAFSDCLVGIEKEYQQWRM